jgi:hypothetical protein
VCLPCPTPHPPRLPSVLSRVCGSGGSHLPSLNSLLSPFGISFGTEVYSGQHSLHRRPVGHFAGTSIRRFPAGGLLHQAVLTRGVQRGERGWVGGDGAKRQVGVAGFYRLTPPSIGGADGAAGDTAGGDGDIEGGGGDTVRRGSDTAGEGAFPEQSATPASASEAGGGAPSAMASPIDNDSFLSAAFPPASADSTPLKEEAGGVGDPPTYDSPLSRTPTLGGPDSAKSEAEAGGGASGGFRGWIAAWADSSCLDDAVPPRAQSRQGCIEPFTALLVQVLQPGSAGEERAGKEGPHEGPHSMSASGGGGGDSREREGMPPSGGVSVGGGLSPVSAPSSLERLFSSRGPAWRPFTLAHTSPLLAPYIDTGSPYTPELSHKRKAAFKADSRTWAAFAAECRMPNASCQHPLVPPPVWLPARVMPAPGPVEARASTDGASGGRSGGVRAAAAAQSLHAPVLFLSVAALFVLGGVVCCLPRSRRRRRRGGAQVGREGSEKALLAV